MRSAFNANHGCGGRLSGLFQRLRVSEGKEKMSEAEEDWPGQKSTTVTYSKMRPLRQRRRMARRSKPTRGAGTQGPTELSPEEREAIEAGQKSVHECLRRYYERKRATTVGPTTLV